MQTNNSSSNDLIPSAHGHPTSSETKVGTVPSNKSLSQSQEITTEALKNNGPEESSNLQSKSIAVPQQLGFWNSITRYFNRRFSGITKDERQQAENINMLIGKTERAIEQVSISAREATNKERKLAGKFPSTETVANSEKYLNEMREKLATAKKNLQELKSQEETARELADKHSAYDALPGQIQKLETNIAYLEARVEIAEKLFNIEMSMKDYHFQGTWERFIKVQDERKALVKTLKDILKKSNLKTEGAQKILEKEILSGADVHQFLKSAFPDLKGYIERLWNGTLVINEKKAKSLSQQAEVLKGLFSLYKKESNQIYSLEKSIYSNSMMDIGYRFFVVGKESLIQDLKKVRKGQRETYKEIKKAAKFNSEEISWLADMGKGDPSKQRLSLELEGIGQEVSYLDLREEVADQMNILRKKLKLYRADLTLRSEVKKINKAKKTSKAKDFARTQDLRDSIRSTIQELALGAKKGRFKQESLPKKFNEMNPLDQLKILISLSFPTLQYRNEDVFQLIEKSKLHEELNQALKVEEQVIPAPTEIATEEQKIVNTEKLKLSNTNKTEETTNFPLPPPNLETETIFPDSIVISTDFPLNLPPYPGTEEKNAIAQPISEQTLEIHPTQSPSDEQYKKTIDVEPHSVEREQKEKLSLQNINIEEVEQKITPQNSKSALEKTVEKPKPTAKETKPSVDEQKGRNALLDQIKNGRVKLKKVNVAADATAQSQNPYLRIKKLIEEQGYTIEKINEDAELKELWNSIPEKHMELTLLASLKNRRFNLEGDDENSDDSEWEDEVVNQ